MQQIDGTWGTEQISYYISAVSYTHLILEAGVFSLKIEGRMKSPRYTAGVVSIYRKYVDQYMKYGRKGYQVDPKAVSYTHLDVYKRQGTDRMV